MIVSSKSIFLEHKQTYHSLMDDPSHLALAIEKEQHQDFGSSALFLAQNNQYLSHNNDLLALGELATQQKFDDKIQTGLLLNRKNRFLNKPPIKQTYHSLMVMDDPSHLALAIEKEQHQDFGSSALFLAQNNQYLSHNNDLLALGELATQQKFDDKIQTGLLLNRKTRFLNKPPISFQGSNSFGKLISKARFSDNIPIIQRFQL
ncbi:unnamed protein product [Eruca vesicaria subsp. sativa]|uniref:Uncharacterized protein n=1 Tax=Eruca vesicaria subsp. sativa TaxID=29727 RepID=A0ABC8K064_ERUVS|nr:unnamed protein product [Eruca vesicaria subsp. sativa]